MTIDGVQITDTERLRFYREEYRAEAHWIEFRKGKTTPMALEVAPEAREVVTKITPEAHADIAYRSLARVERPVLEDCEDCMGDLRSFINFRVRQAV